MLLNCYPLRSGRGLSESVHRKASSRTKRISVQQHLSTTSEVWLLTQTLWRRLLISKLLLLVTFHLIDIIENVYNFDDFQKHFVMAAVKCSSTGSVVLTILASKDVRHRFESSWGGLFTTMHSRTLGPSNPTGYAASSTRGVKGGLSLVLSPISPLTGHRVKLGRATLLFPCRKQVWLCG
jgi:hypothetical protein